MNKRIISTAYHEAGHVVALILLNKRFKYVTIIPMKGDGPNDSVTLGHVKYIRAVNLQRYDELSFFKPVEFDKFFKPNFQKVAGFIAEKIHFGRYNNIGASSDFKTLVNVTLKDLPENLNLIYQKFLLDYTKEVLTKEINWVRITAIAEALLERKTLNYKEVMDVIFQSSKTYIDSKTSSKRML